MALKIKKGLIYQSSQRSLRYRNQNPVPVAVSACPMQKTDSTTTG
jgi:hypothetical protein